VERQELAEEYQTKTDEELLRLALDPVQLTPKASSVLNDELALRRINSAERLKAFHDEEEQLKDDAARTKNRQGSHGTKTGFAFTG
jgi:hypothetical protein